MASPRVSLIDLVTEHKLAQELEGRAQRLEAYRQRLEQQVRVEEAERRVGALLSRLGAEQSVAPVPAAQPVEVDSGAPPASSPTSVAPSVAEAARIPTPASGLRLPPPPLVPASLAPVGSPVSAPPSRDAEHVDTLAPMHVSALALLNDDAPTVTRRPLAAWVALGAAAAALALLFAVPGASGRSAAAAQPAPVPMGRVIVETVDVRAAPSTVILPAAVEAPPLAPLIEQTPEARRSRRSRTRGAPAAPPAQEVPVDTAGAETVASAAPTPAVPAGPAKRDDAALEQAARTAELLRAQLAAGSAKAEAK